MEWTSSTAKQVGVIGLGNVLMGDDAFGPYVIQVLEAGYDFPENVKLMDLGTPSLDLVAYIEDLHAAIIIDCVHTRGEAGELRLYNRGEILRHPIQPRTSPHEPGLKEALLMAEFEGRGPLHVLLVGVIPESTATGVGLSAAVREAISPAVGLALDGLERLGVKVTPKPYPAEPDIWWEARSQKSEVRSQKPEALAEQVTDHTRKEYQ